MAMLADPTNYGNKPGSGPLRVGGVDPDTQPLPENDLPSTMSKKVKEQMPALTLVRDVWRGTPAIRDKSIDYLPKAPGEDNRNYYVRLQRSVFFNVFRRSIEGLAGLVFSKDPLLSDDVPPQTIKDWENIDNAGTHGDVFLRERLQDALIAGHCAILVDYPDTDGLQTAADEMELRPYWVPIYKDNIVSWRTEVVSGKTLLTRVVLKECVYEPDGMFGEKEQTYYRVLYRNPPGVTGEPNVGWALFQVLPGNILAARGSGYYRNQVEIPIAEVVSSGRTSIFDSTPPLLDLAYMNVAHYQQWSDYATSIHKTCVPILFGHGFDLPPESELINSPNAAVIVPAPNAGLMYVAHDGQALGSCEKSLENLKSDMATLGIAMLSPQKRVAESAEAKRLDKSSTDSSLAVTARGLQDATERALEFHARYYQLEDGGSIEINRDYEGVLMDSATMAAFAALVAQGLPWEVALEQLQRGGRIAQDIDVDELAREVAARELALKSAQAAIEAAKAPVETPKSDDTPDKPGDKKNV